MSLQVKVGDGETLVEVVPDSHGLRQIIQSKVDAKLDEDVRLARIEA